MNSRRILSIIMLLAAASPLAQALAQSSTQGGASPRTPAPKPAIATVGVRRVPKEEFEQRAAVAVAQFAQRNGGKDLPGEFRDLIRRQVLEGMIRIQLLAQEAARTNVTVDPLTAEQQMKQDPFFNPNGKYDESRFLAVKTTQPAAFNAARENVRSQLAARKLNEQLESRFAPADADLRASAMRTLTRATVQHLSLRRADINGGYPEPRELAVVNYYKSHQTEYLRVDRATVTVAFVNTPGISDSLRAVPAALQAWTSRMRSIADSLLAEIAKGRTFEEATAALGPRPGVVLAADNFPGYWQGSAAQSAAVFKTKPGEPLREPIPATEGFVLVRVDDVKPAHIAQIGEVSREIRNLLRRDARLNHALNEARAVYASLKDSLAGPGAKVRYAFADTARMAVGEPTADDVDHYYRGHLADYSTFDTKAGGIVARPLTEVQGEIRRHWIHEQRQTQARLLAEQVHRAWSAGKRDPAAEAKMESHEPAAAPVGADVDTGMVARALSDTLWKNGVPSGTGMLSLGRGWVVWQSLGKVDKVIPSFEQARPAIGAAMEARRRAEAEAGARKLYEKDPMRFGLGEVVHFVRAMSMPMDILNVKLTRAEVAKYRQDHIDRFSAPEEVRARHILISPKGPGPVADKAAHDKALALTARIKAGEDFGKLCRENSDDPATKDKGGDLGMFGRGAMLDAFEKAAFAMQPGDLTNEPVKTEVGYHIIRCEEHLPAILQPLDLVYTNVASECAQAKADTIAHLRADSLARVLRDPADGRRAAAKLGLQTLNLEYRRGEPTTITNVQAFFKGLDQVKPGQVMRQAFKVRGQGTWIAWVDSITPPTKPTWEEARNRAVDEYDRGASQRALDAKKAELDSLFAAGWSYDSLAALWNGPEVARDISPGRGIPGLGGSGAVDSVTFGTKATPAIALGEKSGWLDLPNGSTRLIVLSRPEPPKDQLGARLQNLRAAELERRLREYFAGLEKRYPVRILDAKLRETAVPGPAVGDLP